MVLNLCLTLKWDCGLRKIKKVQKSYHIISSYHTIYILVRNASFVLIFCSKWVVELILRGRGAWIYESGQLFGLVVLSDGWMDFGWARILLAANIPILNQKNSSSNRKILSYSGFEPKTFGFQVNIATNWAIWIGFTDRSGKGNKYVE
jgi:hypothetical protein